MTISPRMIFLGISDEDVFELVPVESISFLSHATLGLSKDRVFSGKVTFSGVCGRVVSDRFSKDEVISVTTIFSGICGRAVSDSVEGKCFSLFTALFGFNKDGVVSAMITFSGIFGRDISDLAEGCTFSTQAASLLTSI